MTIELHWEDPGSNIIRCDFIGAWTWDEFNESAVHVIEFADSTSNPIHIILNGLPADGLPRGISPIAQVSGVLHRLPDNVENIILITEREVVRIVFSMVARFYNGGIRLNQVSTLEDARRILRDHISRSQVLRALLHQLQTGDTDTINRTLEVLRRREWLYDGSLTGIRLINLDLKEIDLFMAKLVAADLRNACLYEANLFQAVLDKANLYRVDLTRATLIEASLEKAMLQEARLIKAQANKASLQGANLRRANLRRANLQSSILVDAILNTADLREARLSRVNGQGASFTAARMNHVQMVFASFDGASFYNADLIEADLRRCKLRNANLRRANLTGAKMNVTDLRGSDLTDALMAGAVLNDTIFDTDTTLPDGTNWAPGRDMKRFTRLSHPDFWRPVKKPAAYVIDESPTLPDFKVSPATTEQTASRNTSPPTRPGPRNDDDDTED